MGCIFGCARDIVYCARVYRVRIFVCVPNRRSDLVGYQDVFCLETVVDLAVMEVRGEIVIKIMVGLYNDKLSS